MDHQTEAAKTDKPKTDKAKFKRKFLTALIAINALLIVRLLGAAIEFDNWRGFSISSLHLLVVSAGTYWALCCQGNTNQN